MKTLALSLLTLGLLATSVRADDVEFSVRNYSSEPVRLYSNERGDDDWEYEATIRPGGGGFFEGDIGDTWGIADPFARSFRIARSVTLRPFGFNKLQVSDADFGQVEAPVPPPIVQRTMTIVNRSSFDFDVYANHGRDWHREGTVPAGGSQRFVVSPGEGWAIDDPTRRGLNFAKEITINRLNLIPTYTITDLDFNVRPEPEPAFIELPVVNRSRDAVDVYLDNGNGYRREATLRSGSQGTFRTLAGDRWAFDDPRQGGFNPVKTMTVRTWGNRAFSITDSELYGQAGPIPIPIPIPLPGQQPAPDVAITFKNQSIHKVEIFKKRGPFGKVQLNTIGPWGSKTLDLVPGDAILLSRPGKTQSIFYRVPNEDAFFPFKPAN